MSESTKDKGWTPVQIAKSAWASTRLQEPWAITLETGRWDSQELKLHTLGQVLDMVIAAGLGPKHVYTIPAQVDTWMGMLNLAGVNELTRATKSLSREQNLDILAGWFNGGPGLPSPGPHPARHDNTRVRFNLGHPALLNQFLCWLIGYLGAHESIDGCVDRDCEQVINLCRKLQDKPPVRRF